MSKILRKDSLMKCPLSVLEEMRELMNMLPNKDSYKNYYANKDKIVEIINLKRKGSV